MAPDSPGKPIETDAQTAAKAAKPVEEPHEQPGMLC